MTDSHIPGTYNQDFRVIPKLWVRLAPDLALDLGCGVGLYSRELARRGMAVVGLDPNGTSLRMARENAGDLPVLWVRGDARHLPFRDDAFQVVVSVEVLTHLSPEAREETLREVRRTTRQGATIQITLHNRLRLHLSRWLRLKRSLRVYPTTNLDVWPTTPQEAKELAVGAHLPVVESVRYLNYHPRFTDSFVNRHPNLARIVILLEGLLSRTPLLRRCAITFLLVLRGRE